MSAEEDQVIVKEIVANLVERVGEFSVDDGNGLIEESREEQEKEEENIVESKIAFAESLQEESPPPPPQPTVPGNDDDGEEETIPPLEDDESIGRMEIDEEKQFVEDLPHEQENIQPEEPDKEIGILTTSIDGNGEKDGDSPTSSIQ